MSDDDLVFGTIDSREESRRGGATDSDGKAPVQRMLRASELPFPVSEYVAIDIDALVDAVGRNDPNTDAYMDELHGALRDLDPDEESWCRRYYLQGGWRHGASCGEKRPEKPRATATLNLDASQPLVT